MTIAERLDAIQQQIANCAEQHGRDKHSITLLAVSKQQSIERIQDAYAAGQRCFGENYLQEALPKIAALAHLPISWHFIGHIQANKTRKIAENFSVVETVSSLKIAERLNKQRPSHLPPLTICLEINLYQEPDKSGIAPADALLLAKACSGLSRLTLRGLMSIPPIASNLTEARQHFQQLYALWQSLQQAGLNLDMLSMGMSGDFEAAIAEGSTEVRIGTGLFGSRS